MTRTRTLDYFVVDVFTAEALTGNPLAVVPDASGLSAGQMQAIAREFNLSETTFVERRAADIERAEGVRVRIFTTQEELPFAGHPTLGTASVLRQIAPETVPGARSRWRSTRVRFRSVSRNATARCSAR